MFSVRIGRRKQDSRNLKRFLVAALAVVSVTGFLMLPNSSYNLKAKAYSLTALAQGLGADLPGPPKDKKLSPPQRPGPCGVPKTCPEGHFSFLLRSGAANVVKPTICFHNKLLVGRVTENAGEGINIAVVNGRTGDLVKTGHFNMYDGDVESLITFLKPIEPGFAVLMASYDEPATKLNDAARKMIGDLGSAAIQSVGFRDNWLFVGGIGAHSGYEKHMKHNDAEDKYGGWPEMIELEGCLPHYLA